MYAIRTSWPYIVSFSCWTGYGYGTSSSVGLNAFASAGGCICASAVGASEQHQRKSEKLVFTVLAFCSRTCPFVACADVSLPMRARRARRRATAISSHLVRPRRSSTFISGHSKVYSRSFSQRSIIQCHAVCATSADRMIVPMRSATTKRKSSSSAGIISSEHEQLAELDAEVERQERRQQMRAGKLHGLRGGRTRTQTRGPGRSRT